MSDTANMPDNWASDTLINIADYHNGVAFKPKDWVEDGLPIIRIEQLNKADSETDKYNGVLLPNNFIDTGDLIFSWSATLKVVIWNQGPGALNQHLYKVVPKREISRLLLLYILDFNMTKMAGQSQGSTMKHVTRKELSRFKVSYPKRELEQQKIATIIQTVDKTIEKTEALIGKYQQIKAGLMHDLFTRGIGADGKLRPPRDQVPELYQQTPIGWIPKEWKTAPLEKLCFKITDGSHQAVTTTVDGDVPFLFVSCIRNNKILWGQTAKIDQKTYIEISKGKEPKEGVILYSAVGSYGFAARLNNSAPLSFQRHIAYIAPDEEKIISKYLVYWLNSACSRRHADCVAVGNAQKTVTLRELAKFPVLYPCQYEQHQIYQKVDVLDKKISTTETELNKLQKQKSGLMHDLLTGKVPVTVDNNIAEAAHG